MIDFTVVIPHRGNSLGLWATVHSIEEELRGSKYHYNYVIVTNGEKLSAFDKPTIRALQATGKLKEHIHSDEPLAPPYARQRGAQVADGKYLFFFDNHCLVAKQYFDRALLTFDKYDCDLLHSTTSFYTGGEINYEYRLRLDYNFWGTAAGFTTCDWPHTIGMGGHGGIAIKRETFLEVGGYGPEGLLSGYGGEEPLFDLKLWRYGKTVWIDPRMLHYHYNGERGYSRHFTDEYYRNMLIVANVIGGEKWMYKVFDSLMNKSHMRSSEGCKTPYFELLQQAVVKSAQYANEVNSKSKFTLDEVLLNFRMTGVAH